MGISYRERMLAELKNRVISKPTIVPAKETIVELVEEDEVSKEASNEAKNVKQKKAKKK